MRKAMTIVVSIIAIFYLSSPVKVSALPAFSSENNENNITIKSNMANDMDGMLNQYNQPQNCNTLLGNPSDSNSVAWLIDKILSYITIAGIALVVVLSSVDFAKVIVKGDDDAMAKATKKLVTRLILAGLLFFVPTLTDAIFALFNLTSDATCGIQQ